MPKVNTVCESWSACSASDEFQFKQMQRCHCKSTVNSNILQLNDCKSRSKSLKVILVNIFWLIFKSYQVLQISNLTGIRNKSRMVLQNHLEWRCFLFTTNVQSVKSSVLHTKSNAVMFVWRCLSVPRWDFNINFWLHTTTSTAKES